MPLMIESSSSGDNNNKSNNSSTTGVCIACEEEFERKLVEFAAIHAKKTSDEDDEEDDDDDDESNDNRYDEFIDDDDDDGDEDDASSSCSSYSKHVSRTTTVVKKSVKFGNLPRRGREEDDVKVVVMDDSNILSYQVNGASMNIEVTLAPISIDKSNDDVCQGNSTTKISLPCNNSNSYTLGYSPNEDFPSVDYSVLAKEEFIPNCSEEEEGELQQSMTEEETEECGREKDNKTSSSSRNLEQSNNHVQKLEAIREKKFDDGIINLIPPPLLKKTMAAVHAAKEAVVLSKTAAWHKVCLKKSPKHLEEEKLKTPQTSNKTVLAAAGTDVADASTFNESHDHSTGLVVVEDQAGNEEENVMYMKPQSSPSEHKWRTTDVQCNLINEERNPINERDNESQQGSRTGSVQSGSIDCERDEAGDSDELNSSQIKQDLREMSWQREAVEDGNDSIAAMRTLDDLCISKQELIRGSPLENAAENFASLIRHSSNIKADLPPSVARSVIVKSLIAKFWRENSQVKHNQSRFQHEFIGEDNNIDEQKSQMDPVNGGESHLVLSDDKYRMDDTTINDKAISQQFDPLAETSTHSSGIDPPYEMDSIASSVTDPPYETSSLPIIDPPDGTSATNLSFLSSDRDPPEESEPIINFTASTESVSPRTYMGVAERYCKPVDESFYSEDSFYSKWRKIRYDAMSTVELHSRLPNNANDAVNDVDIRSQLAQLEFKFSQSSIRENVLSSVIPIAAFSTSICDKPMDPPSSISESMSNKIFSGALDKMNTLDDYLRLIDVSHNRQRPNPNLPLSPTAAARRQRYKEKLIEEKLTKSNVLIKTN